MSSENEALSAARIAEAVAQAGLKPLLTGVAEQFATYFGLLQRWNARLNLTAIRDPEEILRRHFVECVFCAQEIPPGVVTVLDYGSGAGFPGVPIALCRTEIHVTLAESQGKKASFLREVVRTLGVKAEVYPGRVEAMPAGRSFDVVAMRAVDKMELAVAEASARVSPGGWLAILTTTDSLLLPREFEESAKKLPGSEIGQLVLAQRNFVPRGT